MGFAMKELISLVPNEHLPELEKIFREMVREIRTKVIDADMHHVWGRQRARRQKTMTELVKRTVARIRSGIDRETAISNGCQEPPYPPFSSLDFYVKLAEKKAEAAARKRRDETIRRLIREGLTNAAIARKLNVSVSTVSKASKGGK